jgi:AcrR family transcriptional regulator
MKKIVAKVENQELVEKRHRQIAEAAKKLFSRQGFHKTTMREISKASGIELSYMYKYISSKDDILFLFYMYIQRTYDHVYRSLAESTDKEPVKQLEEMLNLMLEATHKYRRELLTFYTEARHLERDSLRAVLSKESEMIGFLEKLIERGVQEGCFHTQDTFLAANIIQHILVLESVRGWNFIDRYPDMGHVKPVIKFIMRGLGVLDYQCQDRETQPITEKGEEKND